MRQRVIEEIATVAAWEPGSDELAEFNTRVSGRIVQQRRGLKKLVNSPPGFGFRSSGGGWIAHLRRLHQAPGSEKSVTMKPELARAGSLLDSGRNVWAELIHRAGLLDVVPYAAAARADPSLRDRLDAELDYSVEELAGDVTLVASRFQNMTSATVGLALSLDPVTDDELVYLSVLPALLTEVGVVRDGEVIPYDEMKDWLRREVLGVGASFDVTHATRRAELVVRGSGNDLDETKAALGWMRAVLWNADWRPENLQRLRDVVDQARTGLQNIMQGREEAWVNGVATSYWRQDDALVLSTSLFLTRAHDAHRVRWLLRGFGGDDDRSALDGWLASAETAGADATREELRQLAVEALKDLRQRLLARGGARLFAVGSTANLSELRPHVEELVGALEDRPALPFERSYARVVESRLADRGVRGKHVHVGLVNPNTSGGVFLYSAASIGYRDTDKESLLDHLAARLYSGGGAHSLFMKTWGAGLAYSNGMPPQRAPGAHALLRRALPGAAADAALRDRRAARRRARSAPG